MRTKKSNPQVIKQIFHPEIRHCLTCQTRLSRCLTISQHTVVTAHQVVRVIHCGSRCPKRSCPDQHRLYRSAEADRLALPGFTFGLDIILVVGHLWLGEHKTVDEIHHLLTKRLAPLSQTISRREILFLFEAYSALLRAGTNGEDDQHWREEALRNGGLLLSLDGIQPDKGNKTRYVVRDALESHLQAVAELWPDTPHHICQFHAIREADRLMYVLDHRIKTDRRIRLQQKTHEYRQDLHRRIEQAQPAEAKQLSVLERSAATVEGAFNRDGINPLAMEVWLCKTL
jgi:hypothetical protein